MIVLYWMTPDPVTVTEEDSLLAAHRLCAERGFRRIPVVRDGDLLAGIVARADIDRHLPRGASGVPAAADLAALQAIRIADVMTPDPATCEAGEPLEAVSERMRARKVGAFPVLHRGHLVGIITESDILRALGELAWHDSGASRLTIKEPGSAAPERTYELVDLCRRHGTELLAVLTHPVLEDSAMMTTLRVRGERVDELVDALWRAGFDVVDRC
jgi:acetoin utilization protein AcuB